MSTVLIFGDGDYGNYEPLTNLQSLLQNDGKSVDVVESTALPKKITSYNEIWYVATDPVSASDAKRLQKFVSGGGGLYLTGERPCCESLNGVDAAFINSLTVNGNIQIGGLGDADDETAFDDVNSSAEASAATSPNVLTGWLPAAPGGITGVPPKNELTSTPFGGTATATGAVWSGKDLKAGKGRLAILMDINWLESGWWDLTTTTQMVQNLDTFLTSAAAGSTSTATSSPNWSGYVGTATGVTYVNTSFTVPYVDCSTTHAGGAVSIWDGIDGSGNSHLVQAGVGIYCDKTTKKTGTPSPCYDLWTEVLPAYPASIGPNDTCNGEVNPGDVVNVSIQDDHPPRGGSYAVVVSDTPPGGSPTTYSVDLTSAGEPELSAECIVEAPQYAPEFLGLSWLGKIMGLNNFAQLPNFDVVDFTDCSAETDNNGNFTSSELADPGNPFFNVSMINMSDVRRFKATTGPEIFPNLDWYVTWRNPN